MTNLTVIPPDLKRITISSTIDIQGFSFINK